MESSGALVRATKNIEHLHLRSMQPANQDRDDSFHQIVAQMMIVLAFLAQAGSIHCNRASQLDRLGVEGPAVGWNQPRDTNDISGRKGKERDFNPKGRRCF